MSGSLKQQARIMDDVLAKLRPAWMAEEAVMNARLDLHKAQIERAQQRLNRIAQTFAEIQP